MPDCTPDAFWLPFLAYVAPPAAALLSAIALWVASRARGTSEDARSTLEALRRLSVQDLHTPEHSESLRAALDRKKRSSTTRGRGDTST
jgi:hypothetical protein